MAIFLAGIALFLLLLVVLGVVADSWDARERRDARRRNSQARRVR